MCGVLVVGDVEVGRFADIEVYLGGILFDVASGETHEANMVFQGGTKAGGLFVHTYFARSGAGLTIGLGPPSYRSPLTLLVRSVAAGGVRLGMTELVYGRCAGAPGLLEQVVEGLPPIADAATGADTKISAGQLKLAFDVPKDVADLRARWRSVKIGRRVTSVSSQAIRSEREAQATEGGPVMQAAARRAMHWTYTFAHSKKLRPGTMPKPTRLPEDRKRRNLAVRVVRGRSSG